MRKAKQSTAKNVMVLMVDSTDHITGKTGLTLTITASKDGGAFASISPTVTERGNGWYSVALTASHTDTLGDLALHITGAAADPADMVLLVEARSVDDVLPTASYTAAPTAVVVAGAVRSELTTELARIDVATSSRLATVGYTAPNNAGIIAIDARLPSDPADQSLTDAAIAAIPAAPSAVANAAAVLAAAQVAPIHANMKETNDEAMIGDGSTGNKFRSHLVP